ncbi:hypothetical protein DNTS_023524 [Danionella cerebrum]|uniref:DNA-directed RNA polymerase III subunit RPC4 n=1 Tax=Danionella cerebrum TaxID=2873325 RepID=A0A553MTV0_9TELE|nr:hypothetical protein DNTS_023524 [Danionella translucida]
MDGSGERTTPAKVPALVGAQGLPVGRRLPASVTPGRLPTMRSRDLTLGGVKKKTFTPNIIGRKSKEECSDRIPNRSLLNHWSLTEEIVNALDVDPSAVHRLKGDDDKRRDKLEVQRGRQRGGRGRGRGGYPELIQSHSIFEQGPAEMMAKRRGVYDDAKESANSGPSPIINIKKEKETEEETKEILRKLERENFLDDPHLRGQRGSCPVQLPLAVSGWVFKEEFSDCKAEPEAVSSDASGLKVKQEPMDNPEPEKAEPMFKPPPLPQPDLLPDLLSSPEENCCCLKDLQEGLVGKMLVRSSGRVQLVLGNVTLDVALGTSCAFLQELVSVDTEGRRGDLSVLGHVKHKLVCSPDFQALLENRA